MNVNDSKSNVNLSSMMPTAIAHGPDWAVHFCRLFPIEPAQVDHIVEDIPGCSLWLVCFAEDLLWMQNSVRNIALDVGWHPGCEPSGEFVVRQFSWGHPGSAVGKEDIREEEILRSRSYADVISAIHSIVL